jgi:hypothetical protein
MQAPDAPTTPAKAKREQRSETVLLNAQGAPDADLDESEAQGLRYSLLANGKSVDYVFGKSPDADRMFAIFGSKTLATNIASANKTESADFQIAAVAERFAMIAGGQWVDRTREGGPKINPEFLADAVTQVAIDEGKIESDKADSFRADRLARINGDPDWARKVRTYPPVAAAYAALAGRTLATGDDLLS